MFVTDVARSGSLNGGLYKSNLSELVMFESNLMKVMLSLCVVTKTITSCFT